MTNLMISLLVGPTILLIALLAPSAAEEIGPIRENSIQYVDVLQRDNAPRHRTTKYRQINYAYLYKLFGPSIVLRRGELFNLALQLSLPHDQLDLLRLEFSFGPRPQLDKGTLIYLPVETENSRTKDGKWTAYTTRIVGSRVDIQTKLPSNLAIGVWRLKVSIKSNGTAAVRSYAVPPSIYVIFNPWAADDSVYMEREDGRQEYVMNEVGKIYIGNHAMSQGRKWMYGQFHEAVLPAVMLLLDRTRLDTRDRSDVVKVSRAVSALVNSHDENGLLVGNWSGKYGDGFAPWQWTGSATIFEKYLLSGGYPVKFGQCWVFGGVTTTALRTLGIPARTISNFVSAHDTDHSLTVDKFYDFREDEIKGVNGDSVWNFHVWSDAWMARHDLPPGYGGWQAIDATPQETSMGLYQLGPASLEAIRQAKVGFAYDVGFVYSEVNADVVYWKLVRGQWVKTRHITNHVGRQMLTKRIGVLDEYTRLGLSDAEDIVNQYKMMDQSPEERQAYNEAIRYAGLEKVFGHG